MNQPNTSPILENTPSVQEKQKPLNRYVKTPSVLQMEAVECGAACLTMILAYYGVIVPLEEVRVKCGVSRDGSKASNMVHAAAEYGLIAHGYKTEPDHVWDFPLPFIVHWNFDHFVVVEGIKNGVVYLNDPSMGPRTVLYEEFDQSFTGIVLTFEKADTFKPYGKRHTLIESLHQRLTGSREAFTYVVIAGLFLVIPGILVPTFSRILVDNILVHNMICWWKPLLFAMVLTLGIQAFLVWLQQWYLLRLETKMALTSSAKFFFHVFRLPIEFFSQRFAGDISNRVLLNDKIALLLSGQLSTTLLYLITVVFYVIIMAFYSLTLTAAAVGIALLNIVALQVVSRKRVNVNMRLQQELGKFVGNAVGGLQIIETLKASAAETDFYEQWAGYYTKVINAEQELGIWTQLLSAVPLFLTLVSGIAIVSIGGFQVIEGNMSLGMLIAFQSLMTMFLTPINSLVNFGSVLQEVHADLMRLDDVMKYTVDTRFQHEQSAAASLSHPLTLSPPIPYAPKLTGYLELNNITFGYSRLELSLITDFSLSLKPGGRIALVGVSGSGKSTIAKLITGLYAPWTGEILFDGIPIGKIPREQFANSVTMVDQDIVLFEGTVRENLTLWDTTIPDGDILQAAKDAYIHDVIAARYGGYGSMVAEGGSNFSGGQQQRLVIASALVNNPSIIVMDEATSALDPETEKIIDDSIRRRGCTCIIIAHRLSTIRDADEIIVLQHGIVVQRGTHETLKDVEGTYRELIRTY